MLNILRLMLFWNSIIVALPIVIDRWTCNIEGSLMKELLKKNKKYIIVLALILVFAIGIGGVAYSLGSNVRKLEKQLNLGQKYLAELDYEQAQLAFELAISIDPKCAEAYEGAADAYIGLDQKAEAFEVLRKGLDAIEGDEALLQSFTAIGMELADACETSGDYEGELAVYDQILVYNAGSEVTKPLQECLEQYIEQLLAEKNYDRVLELVEKYKDIIVGWDSDVIIDRAEQSKREYVLLTDLLTKIAEKCSAEDYDAVFEIMTSDDFMDVTSYVDNIGEIKAYDTAYGKIGIYIIETESYGSHMIYYGDYDGNIRSGKGVWLGYCDQNNYHAIGNWSEDVPNGNQYVREWSSKLDESVVYRIVEGNVKEGLWDGPVNWQFEKNEKTQSFPASFTNGYWDVIDKNEDGDYVVSKSDGEHGTNTLVIHEKDIGVTAGIAGYAVND